MEEPKIRELFFECKKNIEGIFKKFRYIEINYEQFENISTPVEYTPGGDHQSWETPGGESDD